MISGGKGGGDPTTMGKNRLPPWMQRGDQQGAMPVNQAGGGGGRQQFGLDYQASVPVAQSPYDANYWGGPRSQPAGVSTDMWNLMGAGGGGGGGNASLGGDPTMAKRKLPAWMNMQPAPGGQGMPMGLLGGGPPPATSQLYGVGGGGALGAPDYATSQLFGGGGGGGGGQQLPPWMGGGQGQMPGPLGMPAPPPGAPQQLPPWMQQQGGAASQLFGQFNPASQNFPAYLQSLFRGRRGTR
jgi:hypothetical protein